jgi:hypothetical protein
MRSADSYGDLTVIRTSKSKPATFHVPVPVRATTHSTNWIRLHLDFFQFLVAAPDRRLGQKNEISSFYFGFT